MTKAKAVGFLSGENPFEFSPSAPLPTFIIQLLVITLTCRLIKLILSPLRQPSVISEIIAGIILGPSAMGRIPGFLPAIFPKESLPFLNLMANFGLVLFLFTVGMELDPKMIRKTFHRSLSISLAGMALPFGLGAAVSFGLYSIIEPSTNTTPFSIYLLFLGVAMSITAFPVLARILTEMDLLMTPVGSITISAAAVDDATSWCLLALVVSLINAGSGLNALWVFLMGVAYTLILVIAIRPVLMFICHRSGAFENGPSPSIVFLCLALTFFSAFVTNAIGIDAIFGGFITGLIIPHEGGFARHLTEKIEDLVGVLFLPLYFTLSGLKTQLGTLDDGVAWGMVILVIFTACAGKLSGCAIAARLTKLNTRESLAVGVLMNCKGLVELIVLNLGLDAGVISPKTFAIMIIMALVTTFLTVPLINLVYPKRYYTLEEPTLELSSSGCARKVMVCLNKLDHVPATMALVQALTPPNNGCLDVTALRLIELTERTSSLMMHSESNETMRFDPVVSVFHTFAQLSSLSLRTLFRVVLPTEFSRTVAAISREINPDLVVVPWNGSGSLVDNLTLEKLFSKLPNEGGSNATSAQHASLARDLFQQAPCRVAILVDRGLGDIKRENYQITRGEPKPPVEPTVNNIFMPFFGGPDDRAALQLLTHGVNANINVMWYRHNDDASEQQALESPIQLESHLVQPSNTDILQSRAEDQIVMDNLLSLSAQGSGATRDKVKFSEHRSETPLADAIKFIESLSRQDIVVVGRGKLGSLVSLYGAGVNRVDNERRKVLGDVAESILLSSASASVLVVQETRET